MNTSVQEKDSQTMASHEFQWTARKFNVEIFYQVDVKVI